jgi:hypothetical protein
MRNGVLVSQVELVLELEQVVVSVGFGLGIHVLVGTRQADVGLGITGEYLEGGVVFLELEVIGVQVVVE